MTIALTRFHQRSVALHVNPMRALDNRFIPVAATLWYAIALFCCVHPAAAFEEPAGGCLGFGKSVVEAVNAKAQDALRVVDTAKSGEVVWSETVMKAYVKASGVPGWEKAVFDKDFLTGDRKIPGLQPDTSVARVIGELPAVSVEHGVLALTEALVLAEHNDPDGFSKCFPAMAGFEQNYDVKVAALNKERQEAAKRAGEAERRLPRAQVTEGYTLYRCVRYCNEVRRGYVVQYVNYDELARATTAIQAIVRKAKNDEPGINTDALWNSSADLANGRPMGVEWCQRYLHDLLRMSPVALFDNSKPPER
jgi:hypothetical protein